MPAPFDYEIELTQIETRDNGAICVIFGRVRSFADTTLSLIPGVNNAIAISWSAKQPSAQNFATDIASFDAQVLEPLLWTNFELSLPLPPSAIIDCFFRLVFLTDETQEFPIHHVAINGDAKMSGRLFRSAVDLYEDIAEIAEIPRTVVTSNVPKSRQSDQRSSSQLRCLIDVSDLCQYWGHSIRPTGIQRVQAEILQVSLQLPASFVGLIGIDILYFSIEQDAWRRLNHSKMLETLQAAQRSNASEASWAAQLANLLADDLPYSPSSEDVIVNIGSSWWIPDYHYKISEMKRNVGLRYVPFIHDIIPLVTPQHCAPELVDAFRLWFNDAISTADFGLVNSQHSLRDVVLEARNSGFPDLDFAPVLLNARPTLNKSTVNSTVIHTLGLDETPYVLTVGTLESRKNHALLFEVWARLFRSSPSEGLWKLVCVGKLGYMYAVAKACLDRYPDLSDYIVILDKVSDSDLAELYRNAKFTMFPSFYEGWGLPVTEALSFGKLTVASNTSSIPEAASEGDILLDPEDIAAWIDTTRHLMEDQNYLAEMTERSVTMAVQRSWTDVAVDLLLNLSRLSSQSKTSDSSHSWASSGAIYSFSSLPAFRQSKKSALVFRRGLGWHAAEDWGVWTGAGRCELAFEMRPNDDDVLFLQLKGGPIVSVVELIADSLRRETVFVGVAQVVNIRIPLVSQDGQHILRISVKELCNLKMVGNGEDRRQIGVGCIAMMACSLADVTARLNFVDSLAAVFVDQLTQQISLDVERLVNV
jgi:glycosyltransferase involved in cell wall biosynthesis